MHIPHTIAPPSPPRVTLQIWQNCEVSSSKLSLWNPPNKWAHVISVLKPDIHSCHRLSLRRRNHCEQAIVTILSYPFLGFSCTRTFVFVLSSLSWSFFESVLMDSLFVVMTHPQHFQTELQQNQYINVIKSRSQRILLNRIRTVATCPNVSLFPFPILGVDITLKWTVSEKYLDRISRCIWANGTQ